MLREAMDKRKGFTLIELLVVISIIALLMAILMPALARARKQAKAVVCQSNIRQWGTIFSMYTGDNDGFFNEGRWSLSEANYWMDALRSYYSNNRKIYCCPTATKPVSEGIWWGTFTAWGKLTGGGAYGEEGDYGSYGHNCWTQNPPPGVGHGGPASWHWRTINVKGGADIPLFLDGMWLGGFPRSYSRPPEYEGQYWAELGGAADMAVFCVNRHRGYVNGVFLDLSVRKIGLKELWRLNWHRGFVPIPQVWPDWMEKFKDYD
jgi:prepilin-type N-terminal cleavage/methylation domain-containing protein